MSSSAQSDLAHAADDRTFRHHVWPAMPNASSSSRTGMATTSGVISSSRCGGSSPTGPVPEQIKACRGSRRKPETTAWRRASFRTALKLVHQAASSLRDGNCWRDYNFDGNRTRAANDAFRYPLRNRPRRFGIHLSTSDRAIRLAIRSSTFSAGRRIRRRRVSSGLHADGLDWERMTNGSERPRPSD